MAEPHKYPLALVANIMFWEPPLSVEVAEQDHPFLDYSCYYFLNEQAVQMCIDLGFNVAPFSYDS